MSNTEPETLPEYAAPREASDGEPPHAPADAPKPKRWVALLLTLLLPVGVGHFYLGQRRRALTWFFGIVALLVFLTTFANVFARHTHAVIAIGMLALSVVSVAPFIALYLIPSARLHGVPFSRVVGAAVLAFVLGAVLKSIPRIMILEAFKIPAGSMFPTLEISDHVMVDKWRYGPPVPFLGGRLFKNHAPERGELVVFEYPDPNPANQRQDFVKRTIAIPGDTLEVEGGHPIINGWCVPSCSVGNFTFSLRDGQRSGELLVEFLEQSSYLVWLEDGPFSERRSGPYKVPPGEVWVLGDNRNNSSDSRAWNSGRGAGVPHQNLKGRALFLWLAFDSAGLVAWERIGRNFFEGPKAPSMALPNVQPEIDRCLATRPAVTSPPR